jgi:hypothetical protein
MVSTTAEGVGDCIAATTAWATTDAILVTVASARSETAVAAVHNLYGDERKNVLGRVRFSTPYNHNPSLLPAPPAHILNETRCVRKKTSAVLKRTKHIPRVRASLTSNPYIRC